MAIQTVNTLQSRMNTIKGPQRTVSQPRTPERLMSNPRTPERPVSNPVGGFDAATSDVDTPSAPQRDMISQAGDLAPAQTGDDQRSTEASTVPGFNGAQAGDQPNMGGDQDGDATIRESAPIENTDADAGVGSSSPAEIAAGLMRQDSALMRRADTIGRQIGNRRGVLNSTLSGEAAMSASLDRVLPLAQQEAAQNARLVEGEQQFGFASELSDQEFEQQMGLSRQEYRQQLGLSEQQFGFASELSEQDSAQQLERINAEFRNNGLLSQQDFEQSSQLSDQEFEQQFGLSRQQFQNDLQLQERRIGSEIELAQMDSQSRFHLLSMERQMRESLAAMDMETTDRSAATTMVTDIHELYMETQRSILNNPDLPAAERTAMLENARAQLISQTEMVESLFGIDINWTDTIPDPNPDTTPTTPTPTTPTTPVTGPGSGVITTPGS